ncbi:uncharacterized protein LOC128995414 [Macrosteles quadrilineatus]|uniref:uncharacterized protein LOC128995414 n=1 Tax=Macrosteles quadrilineatus TaxID=74068 RepID=UPI0023E31701|nr:uncharacterized protein LOC128995414 [Macrosteles quadrilineatus]
MAKPQVYSMKWNNYKDHLSGILLQLLETESMVDLTLCAEGERISCHRIILSACSPYFQEILTGITSKNAVVILCGISAEDLRSIMEFVYKGELNVSSERFVSILHAAETLKITGLMSVKNHLTVMDPVNLRDEGLSNNVEGRDKLIKVKQELLAEEENLCPVNLVETAEQIETNDDENGPSFTIITDDNEEHSDYRLQIATPKNKRKREFSRRDYSEEALSAALEDMANGLSLLEASNTHNIPRSTLYARAKSYGITPSISRYEYSQENLLAAVNMVKAGASLQSASAMYGIPKTVLWRRVTKVIGNYALSQRLKSRQRYQPHAKEAAIRALERGEKINKVSSMYKIPKTTLFREKSRLVELGRLPPSCLNKREPNKDSYKQQRLTQAVAACKEGRMSQAAASSTYKVSKTTIWRRLQQSQGRKQIRYIKTKEEPVEENEESVQFEEIVSEIPVTYAEDSSYTEGSFIILAPNGEFPVDFEGEMLVAENVEDVGEIIEIPTYVEEMSSQMEECSTTQENTQLQENTQVEEAV